MYNNETTEHKEAVPMFLTSLTVLPRHPPCLKTSNSKFIFEPSLAWGLQYFRGSANFNCWGGGDFIFRNLKLKFSFSIKNECRKQSNLWPPYSKNVQLQWMSLYYSLTRGNQNTLPVTRKCIFEIKFNLPIF